MITATTICPPSAASTAWSAHPQLTQLPVIFLRRESGDKGFWEFFTAKIRNRKHAPRVLRRGLAVFETVRTENPGSRISSRSTSPHL
jgi:hypothetical protein